ncbi:MAG: VCBS repeat-containing protein [Polyangiaceae bacterium]|nr:VCBS repeat-containing protein [Polyangiaceae bacterium]
MALSRSVSALALLLLACSARSGGDEAPADAGSGGSGGSGGGGGAAGATSFALPPSVDLGAAPHAVAAADLDGDGLVDLVALVDGALIVAWGAESNPFSERVQQPLSGTAESGVRAGLAPRDVTGDDVLDVVTSAGVWKNLGGRSFDWSSFGDEAIEAFRPVAVVNRGNGPEVVRGSAYGTVELCAVGCSALPGQPAPCGTPDQCPITDLTTGDFDGDAYDDVLAGRGTSASSMWSSVDDYAQALVANGVVASDCQAGDVDRDGVTDVVAGASDRSVWLASPGGVDPFFTTQSFPALHPGALSALADADADGCLDLIQVAPAFDDVGVRLGSSSGQGCAEQLSDAWTTVPGVTGAVRLAQLDANGDAKPEWLLLTSTGVTFVTIPAL